MELLPEGRTMLVFGIEALSQILPNCLTYNQISLSALHLDVSYWTYNIFGCHTTIARPYSIKLGSI